MMNNSEKIKVGRPAQTVRKVDRVFQQAFTAHQAGKLDEAGKLYRRVLRETPRDMESLYLLGTVCSQMTNYDEAATFLEKALAIEPTHLEALNSMGLTVKGQRKPKEALAYFERALALNPNYADALSNLANTLEMLGRLDEALPYVQRSLELKPDAANAHYTLGLIMRAKDRFEDAARCFLRGLELQPDFSVAYDDLGGIYKIWGRHEQALACFKRALELSPGSASAHSNMGTVYEELNRLDEALAEYESAIALNPELRTPKWNQAFLFLRQGILDRGWEAHELRFKGGSVFNRFPYAVWDGSSLEDKTILLYAEQGLGDEIFYASCFPDMLAKAKHCVIECEPRLAPLFARSFPTATVQGGLRDQVGWLTSVPAIDVQSAAGSLPRFVRPTLESFPDRPGYLFADPQRVEYWRARLATLGPEMKVGICWRSGNVAGERHKQYSQLTQWANIFGVAGVRFINLQYGECAEELREAEETLGLSITAFPELNLRDEIDESAALMASLDLVITAGTAVSELAGALGVAVFRLDIFGKSMDALGTSGLPWHPATRLFGQTAFGDWNTALALVAEALKEKVLGIAGAVEYVQLPGQAELAVNGSLDELSTYVLKEQNGWFDPEYAFVLGLMRPGMSIVDVGAGVGAYAIPSAKKIENGNLLAITQTSGETNLLQKSKLRNGLGKNVNVAIADQNLSLDDAMDRLGLDDIAFVRIATEMGAAELFTGAARFFSVNSPLLMFGIKPGEFDFAITGWLIAHGYAVYRLVPGLGLLVPFLTVDELDVYALNLFACKPDRAASLEQEGVLIRGPQALENFPGIERKHWQEYLGALPYAHDKLAGWADLQQPKEQDWEVYWMALNLFALSQSQELAGGARYACLQTALGVLTTLVGEQANVPRLLTLCRVLTESGKREAAVILLNQMCGLLYAGDAWTCDEPFLALETRFASTRAGDQIAQWVTAMVLEQRDSLRAFSTFFTGEEALAVLEEVQASGFGSADAERRIKLIKARFRAA